MSPKVKMDCDEFLERWYIVQRPEFKAVSVVFFLVFQHMQINNQHIHIMTYSAHLLVLFSIGDLFCTVLCVNLLCNTSRLKFLFVYDGNTPIYVSYFRNYSLSAFITLSHNSGGQNMK